MRLTKANYFSKEAELTYFSSSQIKGFLECPARTMAEIRGEYTRPHSPALLVGSYVDAYFTSEKEFKQFRADHPDIFKRDGSLKSEFAKADEMIMRALAEPLFMGFMKGRKQTVLTGNVLGYPFKAKLDIYKKGDRIVDLKTVRDMEPMYKPGQGKVTFAEFWNWTLQMAIYQAVEGNGLPCYLNVITKEEPPGIAVIQIPQHHMAAELKVLEKQMPLFDAVKQGIVEPERCEKCAYCRATRKLTEPIDLDDLIEL